MDVSTSNTGPTITYASGYISWKIIYYLFRKVSCRDARLLGAAIEAPHHLAAAEVRQVPHDAVHSGCGLRSSPRVPRSRRRGSARTPRTSWGTRAGAPQAGRPGERTGVPRAERRGGHATARRSRRGPNIRCRATQTLRLGSGTPATAEGRLWAGSGAGAGRLGRAPQPTERRGPTHSAQAGPMLRF